MTSILALDIATHTGWCTKTASGVWNFTTKSDESKGMKLLRFKAKLKEVVAIEEINLIAFERTAGHHKNALIVQAELHGVLKLFCEENKIEYRSYSAKEIKLHATGKGSAGKPAMIKAAQEKYGYTGEDDNTADAIHIYHLTKSMYE